MMQPMYTPPRPPAPPARAFAQQPLGASERLFVALHRFTATNVLRMIALEGALSPATLRAVLPALQARHPLLGVQVADGAFVSVGDAPIRLEVVQRCDGEHWHTLLEALLNEPLSQRAGPLLKLVYLYSDGQPRAELFVVADHVICDGVSINALCAELLALCAGARPRAPRPSHAALDALLPRASRWAEAKSFAGMLARFAGVSLLRRLSERQRAGSTTRFLSISLTRAQTSALIVRARAEGTTVTGALMAAALLAAQQGRRTSARLALNVPVNLRPHLPDVALEAQDLGHYTNVVYLSAGRVGALWPLARELKGRLAAGVARERLLVPLAAIYEAGARFVRAGRPPFAHALVSSSGIVGLPTEQAQFRPVEFYSATSGVMLSADLGFFCNTFDGRLRINLVFLEEVIAPAEAAAALASVHRLLTT